MNYGDYNSKLTAERLSQSEKVLPSQAKSSKAQSLEGQQVDTKIANLSQEIFETSLVSNAGSLNHADLNKDVQTGSRGNSSEEKLHIIGTSLLLPLNQQNGISLHMAQEGLQVRQKIESQIESLELPKQLTIKEMNEDQLSELLSDPNLTEEELLEILERLDEISNALLEKQDELLEEQEEIVKKQEEIFLKEEDVYGKLEEQNEQINEKFQANETLSVYSTETVEEVSHLSYTLEELLEHAAVIGPDGILRAYDPSVSLDEAVIKNLASLSSSGKLFVSREHAHLYKVGQVLSKIDSNGVRLETKITSIIVLTDEEFKKLQSAFMSQYLLPPPELEEKEEDFDRSVEKDKKEILEKEVDSDNEKVEIQSESYRVDLSPSMPAKSKRQVDEQRLEEFIKFMDLKEEKIKKAIKNHELMVEEINSHHEELSQKEWDLRLEQFHVDYAEADYQYKNLMKQISQLKPEIEIPLTTLEKVEKIETDFIHIEKLLPKEVNGVSREVYEALAELVPLKKQILSIMKDIINPSEKVLKSGSSRSAKTGT